MKNEEKTIEMFLGGGVKLLEGDGGRKGYRHSVVDDVVSSLNSKHRVTKKSFFVNTFADLTRHVIEGRKQDVYNDFIHNEADIAVFILDGAIGDKTKEEIRKAYDSYCQSKHPIIFIYGTKLTDESESVAYLNSISQYYQHFTSEDNLKLQLTQDLMFFEPMKMVDEDERIEKEKQHREQVNRIKSQIESKKKEYTSVENSLRELSDEIVRMSKEVGDVEKRCPVCGTENPIGSSYCEKCGWMFNPPFGTHRVTDNKRLLKSKIVWNGAEKTHVYEDKVKRLQLKIDDLISSSKQDGDKSRKEIESLKDKLQTTQYKLDKSDRELAMAQNERQILKEQLVKFIEEQKNVFHRPFKG